MSATIITHALHDSWVGWADARPPRLACGATREAVEAHLREQLAAVQPDAVPAAPVQVSVLLLRKRSLLSPGRVLAHIAKSGRPAARIIIAGADPFNDWPLVESWIVNCGDQLRRNGGGLAIAIQIESRLPLVPAGFMDFACRNAGWCALTVLDDGDDEALSRRRQDRAAELTDLGCRVSAKLGLARNACERWMELD
jgi:hypothetical protein